MRRVRTLGVMVAVTAGFALGAGVAAADEAKTPVKASMLINILTRPIESREVAFDESLKRDAPAPARSGPFGGEVQPDGSVKYGNVSVTVKNPCPPGTHYEPIALPGRRAGR